MQRLTFKQLLFLLIYFFQAVVALYSFDASTAEELSFRKGERLDIIEHPAHDPDWWMAKNNRGQTGLIPRNYIEVLKNVFINMYLDHGGRR